MKHLIFILAGLITSVVLTVNANAQGMGKMHEKGKAGQSSAHMQKMDANKDGKISSDEWDKNHDDMFTRIDTNKDGYIDEKEMTVHHQSMMKGKNKNQEMMSKNHLAKMDTNGEGKISRNEWNAYHRQKFDNADINKDGSIDKKEMKACHQSMMDDMMDKGK